MLNPTLDPTTQASGSFNSVPSLGEDAEVCAAGSTLGEVFSLPFSNESSVEPDLEATTFTLAKPASAKRGRSVSLENNIEASRNGSVNANNSLEVEQGSSVEGEPSLKTQKLDQTRRPLNPDRKSVFREVRDSSNIAIISREASQNFQKNFVKKIITEGGVINNKPAFNDFSTVLDGQQGKFPMDAFDQAIWTTAILKGKQTPHVLAFIEGTMDKGSLVVKEDSKEVTYVHKFSRPGTSKTGKDAKQDMHFFVRADLQNVYDFKPISIKRRMTESASWEDSSQTKNMDFVGINYQTEGSKKYQHVIVHIPNEFIGTKDAENLTHEAFIHYAEELKKGENVIVTGYAGDTNYNFKREERSAPSTGGMFRPTLDSGGSENEQTSGTFPPHSSGAKKPTFFMQHVSFDKLHEFPNTHANMQASTLNLVIPPKKAAKEKDPRQKIGIDHPSIMTRTLHTSQLKTDTFAPSLGADNATSSSSSSSLEPSLATGNGTTPPSLGQQPASPIIF